MYIYFSGTNDLYISIRSGYTIERHPLKWKVTTLCKRHDFKGIFIYVNDSISEKFLDESFRSLSYLSRTTWIIAFGCLWRKLCLKYEDCSIQEFPCKWRPGRLVPQARVVPVSFRARVVPWGTTRSSPLLAESESSCFPTCSNQFQTLLNDH